MGFEPQTCPLCDGYTLTKTVGFDKSGEELISPYHEFWDGGTPLLRGDIIVPASKACDCTPKDKKWFHYFDKQFDEVNETIRTKKDNAFAAILFTLVVFASIGVVASIIYVESLLRTLF